MVLLAAILAIGLMLGWGLGGGIRALADVRIRLWPAIPVALLLQVIPVPRGDGQFARLLPVGLLVLSYVVLAVVAVANWQLRGFGLILIGLLLNGAVVTINEGMPVSAQAIRQAGDPELLDGLPEERGGKHHLAGEDDVLLFLSDTIAIRKPFSVVVSPGDIAIDVGAALFLAAAMLGRPVRNPRDEESSPSAALSGTRR